MTIFYSLSSKGFYDSGIHGNDIPNDSVEISTEYYNSLMEGQSSGRRISWDSSPPELVDSLGTTEEELGTIARSNRNKLLKDSDWTQLEDAPVNKIAWKEYRQSLRDITSQEGFPTSILWPVSP